MRIDWVCIAARAWIVITVAVILPLAALLGACESIADYLDDVREQWADVAE